MRIHSWLAPLLLLAVSCMAPTRADDLQPTQNATAMAVEAAPPEKAPLQGSVRHSETVAPIPLQYGPGAKMDEQSLPKLIPENRWYPVPNWLAGTWQFKTETVTFLRSFDKKQYPPVPFTLHNEFQKTYGYQKDKSGQVWDYLKAPFRHKAKLDGGLVGYVTEGTLEVVKSNNEEVLRRLTGVDSIVDSESQAIVLTNQKECFNRLTQFGEDAIHLDGSTKIFGMDGAAQVLKFSNMLGMRTKPFEIVDSLDGQNLRQMFVDFLKGNGKADLAP